MQSRTALIQLISEQTMQNAVPLLALKAAKAYHLATPRTSPRSIHIIDAARQSCPEVELENIRLSSMPSIPETSRATARAVANAKELGLTPVVNFTGGTKLMSIGAYEAALTEQVASLYVDTENQQFLDGYTGPKLHTILGDDLSFTSLHDALTVDAVAVANGRPPVTVGRDWRSFAALAYHFFRTPTEEEAVWMAIHGPAGLCPNSREPRDPAGWLKLLETRIELSQRAGDLAVEAGLLKADGPAFRLNDPTRQQLEQLAETKKSSREYFAAVGPLQFALGFMTGGWWEVVVADAADRSGQFRDLRWSVHVGERQGGFTLEEDVVAVDGVQVAYFSCKRGGTKDRLMQALGEADNRARAIGGNFTRRFLAVRKPISPKLRQELDRRAAELNRIQIITPEDLERLESFARIPR